MASRLMAHIGLGGHGVPQLVGGDGADPGGIGQMPQGFGDAMVTDVRLCSTRDDSSRPGGSAAGDPVVEQVFELWAQQDVAVVVRLPIGIRSQ